MVQQFVTVAKTGQEYFSHSIVGWNSGNIDFAGIGILS